MVFVAIAGVAVCCIGLYGVIRNADAGRRAIAITAGLCGTSMVLMAAAPAGRVDARAVALLFTLLLPVLYRLGFARMDPARRGRANGREAESERP